MTRLTASLLDLAQASGTDRSDLADEEALTDEERAALVAAVGEGHHLPSKVLTIVRHVLNATAPSKGKPQRAWFARTLMLAKYVAAPQRYAPWPAEELERLRNLVAELRVENAELRERRSGATRCETSGKVVFVSEDAARAALRTKSARLRVYRCESCGGWHMTKRAQ